MKYKPNWQHANKQTGPFHHGMGHNITNGGNMKRNISFIGISAMMYYFLLPFCLHIYMASMETGNHFIIASMAFFSVIIIAFSSIPLVIGIDGIINSNQMEE